MINTKKSNGQRTMGLQRSISGGLREIFRV
jgi:hypothetical protein